MTFFPNRDTILSKQLSLPAKRQPCCNEPEAEGDRSLNRSLLPSTGTQFCLTGKGITPSLAHEVRSYHCYVAGWTTAAPGVAQPCAGQAKPQHTQPAQPLTYFCSTVDIFDGKHLAQSVQENFGKSWHQLGGCDQDVHAVFSKGRKNACKSTSSASGAKRSSGQLAQLLKCHRHCFQEAL